MDEWMDVMKKNKSLKKRNLSLFYSKLKPKNTENKNEGMKGKYCRHSSL